MAGSVVCVGFAVRVVVAGGPAGLEGCMAGGLGRFLPPTPVAVVPVGAVVERTELGVFVEVGVEERFLQN